MSLTTRAVTALVAVWLTMTPLITVQAALTGAVSPTRTISDIEFSPGRLAFDTEGNLFVSDPWGHRVVVYNLVGTVLESFEPSNTSTPLAIAALSGGELVISDMENGSVDIYDHSRVHLRSLGAGSGEFQLASDIAVDLETDEIFVVDTWAHRIRVYKPDGTLDRSFGVEGPADGQLQHPIGITINPYTREVYVADQSNGCIEVYSVAGLHLRTLGSRGPLPDQFVRVQGLAIYEDGTLFVADAFQDHVLALDSSSGFAVSTLGEMSMSSGVGFLQPLDVAIDPTGYWLVVASHNTAALELFQLITPDPGTTQVDQWGIYR